MGGSIKSIFFFAALARFSGPALANLEGPDWVFHHNSKNFRFKWVGGARGTPMIPLADLAKSFDLDVKFDPLKFEVTLTNPKMGSLVKFHTYDRSVEGRLKSASSLVGFTIELSRSPQFAGLRLTLPLDFGDRALRPLLTGLRPTNPLVRKTEATDIVLDPGHGGDDYGTTVMSKGVPVHEKDVVLGIAWDLRKALALRDVKASLTREDDSFLSLPERSKLANHLGGKLFVSLHMNADPKGKGHGFELYVLSLKLQDSDTGHAITIENQMIPEDLSEGVERAVGELRAESNFERSLDWAKGISAALQPELHPAGRPVRTGPFYVLYGAEMPSMLLELGYLTNAADRADWNEGVKRDTLLRKLADALAKPFQKTVAKESNN